MNLEAGFAFEHINQVALVVTDLDGTMQSYWQELGIGPWSIYTFGPPVVKDMTYRGRRQDYRMRVAFARRGELQLELIQSLEGPTIYDDFLEQHGEGLHHFGIYVPSIDAAIRSLSARGYELLQSGRGYGLDGDGGYAYFDTFGKLAVLLEVIEVPARRRPPDAIYPPPAATT